MCVAEVFLADEVEAWGCLLAGVRGGGVGGQRGKKGEGSRGEGSRRSTGYGRWVEFSSFNAFKHTGFYSNGVERANRSPDHTCTPETRSLRGEFIPFYLLRERANDVCTR